MRKRKLTSLSIFIFLLILLVMYSDIIRKESKLSNSKIEVTKQVEKKIDVDEEDKLEGTIPKADYIEENNYEESKPGNIEINEEVIDLPNIQIPSGTIMYNVENTLELRKRNYKVGDIISTDGYYMENDGGQSIYTITDERVNEDGFRYIKLENGLVANLLTINTDYINVMQAGIKINDSEIASKLNILISYAKDNAKGIKFNPGRYIISKQINICAMDYIGQDTEIWVSDDFTSGGNLIMTNDKEYNEKKTGGQYRFENITFIIETTDKQSFKGMESLLLCIKGPEKCIIDQCKFIAKQSPSNGHFTPIDLLWFQNGNIENICISNSYFSNEVGKDVQEQRIVGGCIWFSCLSEGDKISNITIQDCKFVSYCSDEIIAFWKAKTSKDIIIEGCNFNLFANKSDNVLAFNGSSFSNLKIKKNEFNINSSCIYIIKFIGKLTTDTYQVDINECSININNDINDISKNVSVFYIEGISSDNNVISIKNLKVIGTENTKYRNFLTLLSVKQLELNITNNTFDLHTSNGILWAENSAGDICIDQNDINLNLTSTFMVIRNTISMLKLDVKNNTIENRLNGLMQQNIYLTYNFIGNKVLYEDGTAIFQNDGINASENISILNVENNQYINPNKVSLYYSPNKDNIDKFVVINSKDIMK